MKNNQERRFSRILVTGCGGMLGNSLYPQLQGRGYKVLATDINLTSPWLEHLDVRNREAVKETAKDFNPDIIFHLAAKTNLESCEDNPEEARRTNFVSTQNVALLCHKLGVPIVYIGTIGSFDGEKEGLYTVFDLPNPINVYGKTKWEGEKYIRQMLPEHYIVRACWVMGGGKEKDKKFIGKIAEQIRDGADELIAVTDKIGTPTYGKQFSEVLANLIETPFYGTYHAACKGACTRYDVAKRIVEFSGRDIKVTPIKSDDPRIKKDYYVQRPHSEAMDTLMLRVRGLDTMSTWQEALDEYLEEHFSNIKK